MIYYVGNSDPCLCDAGWSQQFKARLVRSGVLLGGTVAIGTVKSVLYDIRKNLVAKMMERAGFEIINLGTDIQVDKFGDAVRNGTQVLWMSALLTTTMGSMVEVIHTEVFEDLIDRVKIVIGGA